MTRRRVVFTDKTTGKRYMSPEFNGDKHDFETLMPVNKSSCDKNWNEIMDAHFSNINTLTQFITANENAQKEYRQFINGQYMGEVEILPVEDFDENEKYGHVIFL